MRPDGQSYESRAPNETEWSRLVAANQANHIRITPTTAVTRWTGESLDQDLAISALMERRAKNVPDGTPIGHP